MRKKHKPMVFMIGGELVYEKIEENDDFLYRKTMSLTINAEVLETVDKVKIQIRHRNVTLFASKDQIKRYGKLEGAVKTHFAETAPTKPNETKYHFPLRSWTVLRGDQDWASKVEQDYPKFVALARQYHEQKEQAKQEAFDV